MFLVLLGIRLNALVCHFGSVNIILPAGFKIWGINKMENVNMVSIGGMASSVYSGDDLTFKFAADISGFPSVWDWIKARIQAGSFIGLHVGDYIPFLAGGNSIKAEIAGINTYYKSGNPDIIGHHIDFISRDCWPETHVWNKVDYNNGTTVSPYPWLASDIYAWLNSLAINVPNTATANPALVAVDYTTTGVLDKLPTALRNVIVSKWVLLPQRYRADALLTDDNASIWVEMGELWLPSEFEVCGSVH